MALVPIEAGAAIESGALLGEMGSFLIQELPSMINQIETASVEFPEYVNAAEYYQNIQQFMHDVSSNVEINIPESPLVQNGAPEMVNPDSLVSQTILQEGNNLRSAMQELNEQFFGDQAYTIPQSNVIQEASDAAQRVSQIGKPYNPALAEIDQIISDPPPDSAIEAFEEGMNQWESNLDTDAQHNLEYFRHFSQFVIATIARYIWRGIQGIYRFMQWAMGKIWDIVTEYLWPLIKQIAQWVLSGLKGILKFIWSIAATVWSTAAPQILHNVTKSVKPGRIAVDTGIIDFTPEGVNPYQPEHNPFIAPKKPNLEEQKKYLHRQTFHNKIRRHG